jgi:formylglycine-generating enzyme required for sulfatase activity
MSKDTRANSDLFGELKQLSQLKPGKKRAASVWQLFGRAYGAEELPVLADFALERGLIQHCEEDQKETRGKAVRQRVWINPIDGSEMVWIPKGRFYIGPKERKRFAESAGFSLGRHPVTAGQFSKFLAATDYTPPAAHPDAESFLSHWQNELPKGLEQYPAIWLSYLDALAYCEWAGATLPTEWLWEKAARGPDGRPFPWGEKSPISYDKNPNLANVRSQKTCPIGSYPRTRTAYGCEDMIGNVSEWCQMMDGEDLGKFPERRPPIDVPSPEDATYAAVRGSCFLRSSRDRMPAWHRRRLSVIRRNRWVGFRPACFLPYFPA